MLSGQEKLQVQKGLNCPVSNITSTDNYASCRGVVSPEAILDMGLVFKSYWLLWALVLWPLLKIHSLGLMPCSRRVYLAKAEQADDQGRRCWDTVKVPSCGGRCDSREVADWEFPFKISHHPVCVYGSRRSLVVRLRHCDPEVTPGTDVFHFVAAVNCRCKICDSAHTSCEWLPPNSTFLSGISDDQDYEDDIDYV